MPLTNDINSDLDQTDEETLTYEVSDEALEAAEAMPSTQRPSCSTGC